MSNFEKHNIIVPYITRFIWGSNIAKEKWENKIEAAKSFLRDDFPRLVVDNGLAKFAPTNNTNLKLTHVGNALVTNHYPTRWCNRSDQMKHMPNAIKPIHIYGEYHGDVLLERWDILRDLWQEALAPECCKEAYFKSKLDDPYLELLGYGNTVKKISNFSSNNLLAPIGLYINPVVGCSINCKEVQKISSKIEEIIKSFDNEIFETLKMMCEMPVQVDFYRGMALIDTPIFKANFSTDALKEKKLIKLKCENPELFSYQHDWVVSGSTFPYKSIFQI